MAFATRKLRKRYVSKNLFILYRDPDYSDHCIQQLECAAEHQGGELNMLNYKPYFVNMNANYLAIPDDQQLETKTKILTNLRTYSEELATKLALGQKSLDNWDEYISELKKLGLDQLIEIDQQLLDRYNSIE